MSDKLRSIIKEEYTRHGGAFDRGSADSYYHRPRNPHYFKGDTHNSALVEDLSPEEVEAYKVQIQVFQTSGPTRVALLICLFN